jgi:hypothetical protein
VQKVKKRVLDRASLRNKFFLLKICDMNSDTIVLYEVIELCLIKCMPALFTAAAYIAEPSYIFKNNFSFNYTSVGARGTYKINTGSMM